MPGRCCFSFEVSPFDGLMRQNEDMQSDLYDDGDVCEVEAKTYREKVEKYKNDLDAICHELKFVTTMNYHKKLSVLCESMAGEVELHSEKLTGEHNKTLLHVALGLNNVEAANVLVQHGTNTLILSEMTGKKYGGMTALHLAVVNGQKDIVCAMLEKLENEERTHFVNGQTYGTLYSSCSQISNTPLGLCLWCGQDDMYGVLIDAGAELDSADKLTGNTALHYLVSFSKQNPELMIQMIDQVLTHDGTRRWWCRKKSIPTQELKFGPMNWKHLKRHLLRIPNKEGYTPLTLAARDGDPKLLCHLHNIKQVNKNKFWTYGPSSASLYDLSETDPLVVPTGKPAALDILVYGNNDSMLSAIASEPLHSVIKTKWQSQRIVFYVWMFLHLTLMSVFTWWIVESPVKNMVQLTGSELRSLSDMENMIVEMIIDTAACIYLLTEIIDITSSLFAVVQFRIRRMTTGYYKAPWSVIFRYDDFRIILIAFSVSTIVASVLRNQEHEDADICYCIALTCGWYYMLAFLRTFKSFSYYTLMVHKIIFTDMIRFAGVFVFILMGFSAGNMVIFATSADIPDQVKSFDQSMYSLFRLMIGLEEWDIVDKARSVVTASIVFVAFILLTTILLLNMLIASMTDTYAAIEDRESLRMKYLALTCLTIEKRLMPFEFCRKRKAASYLKDCFGKKHCAIFVTEMND